MRHLNTLLDLSTEQVLEILASAKSLKAAWAAGKREPKLAGHVLVQLFEKPSLRTRVSFEVAMAHLGGSSCFLSAKDAGLDGREPEADIAQVVGGYADVIVLRTFRQSLIDTFVEHSGRPVVNGLSDDYHPCQALTDVMTAEEHFGNVAGRKLAYIGDGNNVAKSLALVCAHVGMDFTIAAPDGFQLPEEFLSDLKGKLPNASVAQFTNPFDAVDGADVVYTDVWASMGQEAEKEQRAKAFEGFQVNEKLFGAAKSDAVFMHCLPARRGLEVSAEVMDNPRSVVFPQAENRMHLAKGLFAWLLEK
ncbi:MAG: ornithine carbamoyltransferase [Planctomycetaceae bacterium]